MKVGAAALGGARPLDDVWWGARLTWAEEVGRSTQAHCYGYPDGSRGVDAARYAGAEAKKWDPGARWTVCVWGGGRGGEQYDTRKEKYSLGVHPDPHDLLLPLECLGVGTGA